MFLSEKEMIFKYLKGEIIGIEHIGSTAVPNLAAKPIIDIVVLVPSFEDVDEYIKQLEYDKFGDKKRGKKRGQIYLLT